MTGDRIRTLLANAPVVDGHNDLAWELRQRVRYDLDTIDIAEDQSVTGLHTDIPRLRAGGVGAQFWSVYVPSKASNPVTATMEQIDAVRMMVARYPTDFVLATSADDMETARASGIGADRLSDRDGGWTQHRLLTRCPADAACPGRPLSDVDPLREHALGGQRDR
jgi:hypothetical protein